MSKKYPALDDHELLSQSYEVKRKSCLEIADNIGCSESTVWRALRKQGVRLRNRGGDVQKQKREQLSPYNELNNRDWVYREYWTEGKSCKEVAKDVSGTCSHSAVFTALKRLKICARSISESLTGERNPSYGKVPSEETRIKISESNTGRIFSIEHKEKIRESHKGMESPLKCKHLTEEQKKNMRGSHKGQNGAKNPFFGKHHTKKAKEKQSKAKMGHTPWNKGRRNIYSEETLQKMREKRRHRVFPKHHTTIELIFLEICKKYDIPIKYVGDGALWIENINPDFVILRKRIAIEVFGDYWHSPLLNKGIKANATFAYRDKVLKRHKWKLIVFWESDLKREDRERFVLSSLKGFL